MGVVTVNWVLIRAKAGMQIASGAKTQEGDTSVARAVGRRVARTMGPCAEHSYL